MTGAVGTGSSVGAGVGVCVGTGVGVCVGSGVEGHLMSSSW